MARVEKETVGELTAEIRDLLKDILEALGGVENADAWDSEHRVVDEPGTPKQLPLYAVPAGYTLVIKAMPDNTDNIYLGQSKETALSAVKRVTLQPNESTGLRIKNANLVWIDAVVAGEGVEYWSEKKR